MNYLTTTQAGAIAKVDRRTIVTWIHQDRFAATKLPGRSGGWRIEEEDFYAFMRRHAHR